MAKRSKFARLVVIVLALSLLQGLILHPIASAAALPESAYISGVVGHAQSFELSCESRSAVDLAAFWGVTIPESEFLFNLPRSDNPNQGFVGNPNDPWGYTPPASYGVHAPPVAALLREYGLRTEAGRGLKWRDLRAEIAAGRPVIVWVIGQMWNGVARTYTDIEGNNVKVAPFEHSMILIGYDASRVHVVDAYSGQTLSFPRNSFLNSWSVLGNLAVIVRGPQESKPTPEPSRPEQPSAAESYTVQPGDYLLAVAERFGAGWRELAELNELTYPYTLHPGMNLRLPEGAQARPEEPIAAPTPAEASAGNRDASASTGNTYRVQPGDYLKKIAEQLGMDWLTLAALNDLVYPYVVHPGQVLRLE